MQLLIIAPRSSLDVFAEVLEAAGESNNILHGNVSSREALDHVASGQYDRIYFAGDGDKTRLVFSDGLLDGALLADAVRHAGTIELAIFNSCESLGMALAAYMAGASYVIGWQDEVQDKAASTFGSTFWASYKMGSKIQRAYWTGREAVIRNYPGQPTPILLNGQGVRFRQEVAELRQQIDRLMSMVKALIVALAVTLAIGAADIFWLHW